MRTAFISAAVVIAAVTLAACSSGAGDTGDPSPTSISSLTSSSRSSSSSPSTISTTSPDPAQERTRAALAAVSAFWRELDRITNDPNTSIGGLATLARDDVYSQWMRNIMTYRGKHLQGSGSTIVTKLEGRAKGSWTYGVSACIDSSKTDMTNVDTKKSVIPTPRPNPRVEYAYEVTQDKKSQKWYVTSEKVTGTC
ncbi:MAG: hypothetical protein M3Y49_06050 [Actinomycetota bacterium]|nr:hypothetical protein [Actinomycetota bacterium]